MLFPFRFHGIGCDNQKGVKDLLRMESDESDDEELDIENPSTPDNMSFHGGYDSPPPRSGDLPSRRDSNGGNNGNNHPDSASTPTPSDISDRKPPVMDFNFLNQGALHNNAVENGVKNWLKSSVDNSASSPPITIGGIPFPGLPAVSTGATTGPASHPHHPLHPFLFPFSAAAAAAAAAAAVAANSGHHHRGLLTPGAPPTSGSGSPASGGLLHPTAHHPLSFPHFSSQASLFHVKDTA